MQFITDGPDIPDALLEAHEEGRVVFFCGAGISYPAGLPGFKGLVDKIYQRVGETPTDIEKAAYARKHYDATLDLLERRLGSGTIIRSKLKEVLQPDLLRNRATDTHTALLQLAHNREGVLRLVTTNFDRIFEDISEYNEPSINTYAAPMLPVPKNSSWNGLVYLHGLLPKEDEGALQHLILTSGDFGRAYLTERWASRFVSELFRNYVVCFVGYSINDPVLRYMMDALAADRTLGEIIPQAYALGEYRSSQKSIKKTEWEAKGVIPILYKLRPGRNPHSLLHNTMKTWAKVHQEGTLGREHIITEYALARPSDNTPQDDFVGRMLWALSHESGLPAKRFAEFNPVPSLDWLEVFSEERYQHEDLSRFGVPPHSDVDHKLRFNLVCRPASYNHAPLMSLVSMGHSYSQWDDIMYYLGCWLVRHLNDSSLIIWFAERGGQLHDRLSRMIENELDRLAQLKRDKKTAELEDIRSNSPNAIPSSLMQILWRLLLTGRVKSPRSDIDIYHWRKRLKRDGITTSLRFKLRELLAPMITLKKSFHREEADDNEETPKSLRQLVEWKLVLTANHIRSIFRDLKNKQWRKVLPELLDEFQQLLCDTLDLCSELGEADQHDDRSIWDMPSISQHQQNHDFRDWVVLIELLRDAWLETLKSNPARATKIAQEWFKLPYPTFKRLALFGAKHDECIEPNRWVGWLTIDDAWWLWSANTRREVMRLLVLQGAKLPQGIKSNLEIAIIIGPPRAMYRDDIESARWRRLVDRSVWLRLAKLLEGGSKLGDSAAQRYNELSATYPEWELASNESDEFSHWMSGTGDQGYEENLNVNIAPNKRQKLVTWLQQTQDERHPFDRDTWRETCKRHPANTGFALFDLAAKGIWLTERWNEAFHAWTEPKRPRLTWRCLAPLMKTMPNEELQKLGQSITWWLEAVSKSMDQHEDIFFDLCNRVLQLSYEDGEDTDSPVTRAINHPIGNITGALLKLWLKRNPSDNDSLPSDIEPFFSELCDITVKRFRHGRVLLASRLIPLFRVDPNWTKTHLLPLFDWNSDAIEAKASWEGFLWAPRIYWPLLLAFKTQFLDTVHHYEELGEHNRQFAKLLTYAALSPGDGYTTQDFQTAFSILPQNALNEAAQIFPQALESAGEQREDYWKNRIKPFWQNVWPKSINLLSDNIVSSLARMSIAARGEFPAALSTVLHWLRPIEDINYVMHVLHETDLATRFPEDTLKLLGTIVDNPIWVPKELKQCLEAILLKDPKLKEDHIYRRLNELVRQRDVL